jgi:hypothetical protein
MKPCLLTSISALFLLRKLAKQGVECPDCGCTVDSLAWTGCMHEFGCGMFFDLAQCCLCHDVDSSRNGGNVLSDELLPPELVELRQMEIDGIEDCNSPEGTHNERALELWTRLLTTWEPTKPVSNSGREQDVIVVC